MLNCVCYLPMVNLPSNDYPELLHISLEISSSWEVVDWCPCLLDFIFVDFCAFSGTVTFRMALGQRTHTCGWKDTTEGQLAAEVGLADTAGSPEFCTVSSSGFCGSSLMLSAEVISTTEAVAKACQGPGSSLSITCICRVVSVERLWTQRLMHGFSDWVPCW